jgi:hypothetical protein
VRRISPAILLVATGCGDAPAPPTAVPDGTPAARAIRFVDATATSGLDLVTTCGGMPSREILEVNGGGLALIDFDDDGDLDLFVANGATMDDPEHGPGSRLFRNLGSLRFEDATDEVGLDLRRWAMGVAVGDVDGDGRDDLYVTCFGPNVLLRNVDGARFEDVTATAGGGDPGWGTGAAFGDVDGDGDLDLYVVNYLAFDPADPPTRARHKGVEVLRGPHGLAAQHDVLYENRGGTLHDVTVAAGCRPPRPAYGLNVVIVDADGDGRVDILVGNDSMANFLFRNRGHAADGPRFDEVGVSTGVASNLDGNHQATMGMAVADVDGDGRPDLFTTNFANDTNTLHVGAAGGFFDDRTRQYGLGLTSRPFLGWACAFHDLDHDGDEDLLAFNGHVYPEASVETMDSPYAQTPLLYARRGDRFERVTAETSGAWLDAPHRDRAAAFGDLDGDGDVDAVVSELNGPLRLLRNEAAGAAADWLVVTLDDATGANRRGLGARVDLVDDAGRRTRWLHGGGGFQSASAVAAHFGVPAGRGPWRLEITWPDGTTQVVADVTPGRRRVVSRGR